MSASLKLLSYVISALVLVSIANAVISQTTDGWDETDDDHATANDQIGFSGTGIEGRFVFDLSAIYDTYCIEPDSVQQRAQNYLIDGIELKAIHKWGYADYMDGLRKTIQVKGGTGNTCSFWYWEDRPSVCDGIWLTDENDYIAAGCPPDASDQLSEGSTQIYSMPLGTVEITCLDAAPENYMKCQAPTYADLSDCISDSVGDVNGGDSFALGDLCVDNEQNGVDTESLCDVQSGNTWELSFLDPGHYDADGETQFRSGMPNSTFSIYGYKFCGTAIFDRDLLGQVDLTVFQEKQAICTNRYDYTPTGYVNGYFPWYNNVNITNASYVYGDEPTCRSPQICQDTIISDSDNFNLTQNACIQTTGSCYDHIKNLDETSTDYGGICGSCDNTTAIDDVYYSIAKESNPVGYFDAHPFDSSQYCPDAENTAGLILFVTVFIGIFLILTFLIIGILLFYVLLISSLPFLFALIRRRFKKKPGEKQRNI